VFNFDPDNSIKHEEMCEGLDKMIQGTNGKLCTDCRYCMPCPRNVNIPYFMNIQKNIDCFGLDKSAQESVAKIAENQSFTNCNDCGECEKKCPNSLPIRATFKKLAAM
jgi:predicted aldo/keto reductase-like oxidoreductase